ncbi:hypothetical protein OG474_07320 [Kribbella sp. NBC_01505]|uniref:hypothetical protein n=1 Tax=Kribbella sp. NBC_01505 TaxID=2903580 RepID=UPI00386B50D0
MNRLTSAAAVLAAVSVLGLAGCKSSDDSAAPAPAPTQTQTTPPAGEPSEEPSAPAGGGGGQVCDDEQFVVDLVKSVRDGSQPDDPQAAVARMNTWMAEIPAEIKKPGEAMAFVVSALRHPGSEVVKRLSTPEMKADLDALDAWHAKSC